MSDNERLLLEKFSDLLTGGNAGTWDQIEHAISALTAEAASLRAENERLRERHEDTLTTLQETAKAVIRAEASTRALEAALGLARTAMCAPFDDWKGVLERRALDAARAALTEPTPPGKHRFSCRMGVQPCGTDDCWYPEPTPPAGGQG